MVGGPAARSSRYRPYTRASALPLRSPAFPALGCCPLFSPGPALRPIVPALSLYNSGSDTISSRPAPYSTILLDWFHSSTLRFHSKCCTLQPFCSCMATGWLLSPHHQAQLAGTLHNQDLHPHQAQSPDTLRVDSSRASLRYCLTALGFRPIKPSFNWPTVLGLSHTVSTYLSFHTQLTWRPIVPGSGSGHISCGAKGAGIDAARNTQGVLYTIPSIGLWSKGVPRAAMDHSCPPGWSLFGFDPRRQHATQFLHLPNP
jgi:hypothetical protein